MIAKRSYRSIDIVTLDNPPRFLSSLMFEQKNDGISSQPPNVQTSKPIIRTPSRISILITLVISLLISKCGFDIEDPTPPSPPVWVQKSLPEEWPERGIDAHESGGIFLEWQFTTENNLVAYYIYRTEYYSLNDSFGDVEHLVRLDVESLNAYEYVDTEALHRKDYFYAIKTSDNSNNMSLFSDTISYKSLSQIPSELMSPNGALESLPNNRELLWSFPYLLEMENYCLTLLSEEDDFLFRMVLSPGNYVSRYESWCIPDSIALEVGHIYKWRIDTGAKYVDGLETAGSESPWATFLYMGD